MSHQFTSKEIRERFHSLPKDIQIIVSKPETTQRLEEIGRQRGLRIDEIGILIEYSGLIMLGFIKSKEFVNHLATQLKVSEEQAEAIAVDVDNQLFSRIRESLRKVQYQSTVDSRFTTSDDFVSAESGAKVRGALLEYSEPVVSTEETEGIPIAINTNMSPGDYSPEEFGGGASSAPRIQETPAQAVREGLSSLSSGNQAPTSDMVRGMAMGSGAHDPLPEETTTSFSENENQAYRENAQAVVGKMPGAMQEAYAAREAAAPATETSPEMIKDFKTRLEEKMAVSDKGVVNSDPYRESI